MAFYVVATVATGVQLYGMYKSDRLSREQSDATSRANQTAANQQKKLEDELKNRQLNERALETSKLARARNQALSFGGATKNGTIKTSALGVQATSPGANTKTLLGQ